jgi:thioredoxin-related protein
MSRVSGLSVFPGRRRWLIGAFATLSCARTVPALASQLPSTDSLPRELALALSRGHPLLVMVTLEGCPFCKIARENYLAPLHREQGVPIVQIDMRGQQKVQGFAGSEQTQENLSRSWSIKVAPTVLFFGRGGREVAARLVGASLPDFYGSYLDDRIRQAQASLLQ